MVSDLAILKKELELPMVDLEAPAAEGIEGGRTGGNRPLEKKRGIEKAPDLRPLNMQVGMHRGAGQLPRQALRSYLRDIAISWRGQLPPVPRSCPPANPISFEGMASA